MIHSARPIVTPVANIVFCCFVFLDLKSGDGRTTCAKTMIPTRRDFGLAEWIKNMTGGVINDPHAQPTVQSVSEFRLLLILGTYRPTYGQLV